jgi:hypothetical protein
MELLTVLAGKTMRHDNAASILESWYECRIVVIVKSCYAYLTEKVKRLRSSCVALWSSAVKTRARALTFTAWLQRLHPRYKSPFHPPLKPYPTTQNQ